MTRRGAGPPPRRRCWAWGFLAWERRYAGGCPFAPGPEPRKAWLPPFADSLGSPAEAGVIVRPRPTKRTVLAALGLLCLAVWLGLPYAGIWLVLSRDVPRPHAIIVLASHEWERLPVAARFARRYPAAEIWLTVPTRITARNCHRCSERVSWLAEIGVSSDRVEILPYRVRNTYEEAEAALRYAKLRGVRRILIVTSGYHTRRALATFRRVFAEAAQIGVKGAGEGREASGDWWRSPEGRDYVAYEWAALLFYSIRFGVPLAL